MMDVIIIGHGETHAGSLHQAAMAISKTIGIAFQDALISIEKAMASFQPAADTLESFLLQVNECLDAFKDKLDIHPYQEHSFLLRKSMIPTGRGADVGVVAGVFEKILKNPNYCRGSPENRVLRPAKMLLQLLQCYFE